MSWPGTRPAGVQKCRFFYFYFFLDITWKSEKMSRKKEILFKTLQKEFDFYSTMKLTVQLMYHSFQYWSEKLCDHELDDQSNDTCYITIWFIQHNVCDVRTNRLHFNSCWTVDGGRHERYHHLKDLTPRYENEEQRHFDCVRKWFRSHFCNSCVTMETSTLHRR